MMLCIRAFLIFRKIWKRNAFIKTWIETVQNPYYFSKSDSHPWLNYNLVFFLSERLHGKRFVIFEYGSGYSTIFWAKFNAMIFSIENNSAWFARISEIISADLQKYKNIKHYFVSDESFVLKIREFNEKFDIILIDSYARVKCIKESMFHLSSRGVVILDNSDRVLYRRGINFLKRNGFRALKFRGLSPHTIYEEEATVFYREENIFDL